MALINVLLMKFEKAEAFLTSGIKLGPKVAYNYGLRAYVRIRLDNLDGAINDCTSKLELKPKDASIYALRGWALYCQENYSDAISDFKQALDIDPKRKKDYQDSLRLVDCYQREGLDKEAIDFCTSVLESKIESFYQLELYGRRSISLFRLNRFEECINDLDKAIAYAGLSDKAELHKMKADVLNELEDIEKANIQMDIYQGLKQFEAQITEWVPASIFKRVGAQLINAFILGLIVALLFTIGLVFCWICKIGSINSIDAIVSLLIPCGIGVFLLAFLDSILVCVVPLVLILCLLELVAGGAYVLSVAQVVFITILIVVGVLNIVSSVCFPMSITQATPGKMLLKLKLTSTEGGRMGSRQLVARHILRGLESLFILTLIYYCLVIFMVPYSVFVKLIVAFLLVPLFVVVVSVCLNPGLHNSLTSGFVSDVSMFFDKQIKEFRNQ